MAKLEHIVCDKPIRSTSNDPITETNAQDPLPDWAMRGDLLDPHLKEIAWIITHDPIQPRILGICQGNQIV